MADEHPFALNVLGSCIVSVVLGNENTRGTIHKERDSEGTVWITKESVTENLSEMMDHHGCDSHCINLRFSRGHSNRTGNKGGVGYDTTLEEYEVRTCRTAIRSVTPGRVTEGNQDGIDMGEVGSL